MILCSHYIVKAYMVAIESICTYICHMSRYMDTNGGIVRWMYDDDVMDLMVFTNVAWLMQHVRCNHFVFIQTFWTKFLLSIIYWWSSSKTNRCNESIYTHIFHQFCYVPYVYSSKSETSRNYIIKVKQKTTNSKSCKS